MFSFLGNVAKIESMKKLTIGILAHVDAGKTTLSESLLYHTHQIKKLGRVDHKTSFFDYNHQERSRGITIYSKQARFQHLDTEFHLLDTPGHTDFSTEMERVLYVLDYAILLINGIDQIQQHTKTIWKLLETYQIPTFIFVNKMDLAYDSQEVIFHNLKEDLDEHCILFPDYLSQIEEIALQEDSLLDYYSQHETLELSHIKEAIAQRRIFPCFFGSALKSLNVSIFLDGLANLTLMPQYGDEFGARIFKVDRDLQGSRCTHIKLTGGELKVKSLLHNEKINQIRQYHGDKFQLCDRVVAGDICTLIGLSQGQAHSGVGFEEHQYPFQLTPPLSYVIKILDGNDPFVVYRLLKQLEEEDPQLKIKYDETNKGLSIHLMGEIQTEILKHVIFERFKIQVEFANAQITYMETITTNSIGLGHFEPLKHYAEVHLLLEPLPLGSGIQVDSTCPYDVLSASFQKQVLTTLDKMNWRGLLIGAQLTDLKITLLAGKAHVKHTEANDFKEATIRALRHGLHHNQLQILEPSCNFEIAIDASYLSRTLYEMEQMGAKFILSEQAQMIKLIGQAALSSLQNFQTTLISYTKGTGIFTMSYGPYMAVHDAQDLITNINYIAETDLEQPSHSVFCAHGSGFLVNYDEVIDHIHIDQYYLTSSKESDALQHKRYAVSDHELELVMNRTYKTKDRSTERIYIKKKELDLTHTPVVKQAKKIPCLIVDGYNMIHSWSDLALLAQDDLANARQQLLHMLANYHGTREGICIVVFDAYRVLDNRGSSLQQGSLYTIYTKTAQTADSYIEQATKELSKSYQVSVATSDGLEQLIILGQGALRISARELELQIKQVKRQHDEKKPLSPHRPMEEIKNFKNNEETKK